MCIFIFVVSFLVDRSLVPNMCLVSALTATSNFSGWQVINRDHPHLNGGIVISGNAIAE